MKPRAITQRHRGGIFIESRRTRFPNSIGATYSDATPTGLMGFMGLRGYKDVAPTVLAELAALQAEVDALKRLSVDIDVVYSNHQAARDEALKSISSGLDATRKRLTKTGLESEVSANKDVDEIKLFIRRGRNQGWPVHRLIRAALGVYSAR